MGSDGRRSIDRGLGGFGRDRLKDESVARVWWMGRRWLRESWGSGFWRLAWASPQQIATAQFKHGPTTPPRLLFFFSLSAPGAAAR